MACIVPTTPTTVDFANGVTAIAGRGPTYRTTIGSPSQTSGTLIVGKTYYITTYVAGDVFTNVGGTDVTGNTFTATGTTPTTWTNGSSLALVNAWLPGDEFVFQIVTSSQVFDLGTGYVTGTVPQMALTLNDRVHFVSGSSWYGSDNGNATAWNQQAPGAFFINMANQSQESEALLALSPYQGEMSVYSRRTSQIWIIDANPVNFDQQQVLNNIGTFSPLSVQPLGAQDNLFISDTGIRSLRVREYSLNAYVNDLGSPIDNLVQADILAVVENNPALLVNCPGIVEPQQNRYWVYINGHIYVFTYFPSNQILAWSIYLPTYQVSLPYTATEGLYPLTYSNLVLGQVYHWGKLANETSLTNGSQVLTAAGSFIATATTAVVQGTEAPSSTVLGPAWFTPQLFVVCNGQVYARDSGNVYVYGGVDNNTYDYTTALIQVPFFDVKKPGNIKTAQGVDAVVDEGTWTLFATPDWIDNTFTTVMTAITQSTFDGGFIPYTDRGTHFSIIAQTTDNNPATLSGMIFYYEINESPA